MWRTIHKKITSEKEFLKALREIHSLSGARINTPRWELHNKLCVLVHEYKDIYSE